MNEEMNETVQKAMKKLEVQPIWGTISEQTGYATKCAVKYGPLSTFALDSRLSIWKLLQYANLDKRERKAVYLWLCKEPVRKELL